MRLTALFLFFIFTMEAWGQAKPDFFPEDVAPEGISVQCFCKPGVRNKSRSKGLEISYGTLTGGMFKPEEGGDTVLQSPFSKYDRAQVFEFDLKAPVINKDGFKLLLGYKYTSEWFNFTQIGADFAETFRNLDNNRLKSNALSLLISKPFNETSYLAVRFRYSSNGNYNGLMDFDKKFAIYKMLAVYARKPHDDLEWGIGLNVSQSFRRTSILPFLVYNRNFNEKWGIESALPGFVFGRYNMDTDNIFLFGFEYDSQSYRMEVGDGPNGGLDYALNHSEIRSSLRIEHKFIDWIWGNVELGYQLNFSTDFESKSNGTAPFMVEPSNAMFFHVGLFVSPPDRLGE